MVTGHGADRAHERFSGLLLTHRGRTRLTQRQLASRVGVSMRTIQDWEAGANYPGVQRLQALIAALLELDGMTLGNETEEAQQLWEAVQREAPRMHTPFDRDWFTGLLADRAPPRRRIAPGELVASVPPAARVVPQPWSTASIGAMHRTCWASSAEPKSSPPFETGCCASTAGWWRCWV